VNARSSDGLETWRVTYPLQLPDSGRTVELDNFVEDDIAHLRFLAESLFYQETHTGGARWDVKGFTEALYPSDWVDHVLGLYDVETQPAGFVIERISYEWDLTSTPQSWKATIEARNFMREGNYPS
jgi:hypothetical protein